MSQMQKMQDAKSWDRALSWAKANLFNRWYNGVITVLFFFLFIYVGFYGLRFVFVTSEWEPVRENLTLFMIGRFPREEQWRVLTQIALLISALGLSWGIYSKSAAERNTDAAKPGTTDGGWKSYLSRYWAVVMLLIVLLSFTQTLLPLVFVAISIVSFLFTYQIGKLIPKSFKGFAYYLSVLAVILSYQILSGNHGSAWVWTALLSTIAVFRLLRNLRNSNLSLWVVTLLALASGFVVWVIYQIYTLTGVGWEDWSGFHLNLIVTAISLILAFPLGIILALGRRSSLPAIKYISIGYIELIRGVPLITLLFVGDLFLGFFLEQASSLSSITRAAVVLSIFTSAYMAEIFRGGLRAVPPGQIDAAKAVGLGPFQRFIWIIFPQALRAIIPALVGQSISLFKDTSLLSIISVTEILTVRSIVHTQGDYLSIGIAETLIFVSLAFWAISYTMSKESQRLETKLGVGIR